MHGDEAAAIVGSRNPPEPTVFAWWGVPYDPYGRVDAYAHPYPLQFFDFPRKVKMGAEFWTFVGDDAGTFSALLGMYREVGQEFEGRLADLRLTIAGTS